MQKEKETPNWYRIAGNAGVVFFTTIAAASVAGLSGSQFWTVVLLPALIQGGLSACKEMQLVGREVGGKLANIMLV